VDFYKYHWTSLKKGATVVVRLSKAANVRLMDATNFNAYKAGRNHRYIGGLVKKSIASSCRALGPGT
jgi:hypothetical protein